MKYVTALALMALMCLGWGGLVGLFDSNVAQVPIWLNIPVSVLVGGFVIYPLTARICRLND